MQDEQMRVLKMVEDGRVSPDDGARLLEAIRKKRAQPLSGLPAPGGRALRIQLLLPSPVLVNPLAKAAPELALQLHRDLLRAAPLQVKSGSRTVFCHWLSGAP